MDLATQLTTVVPYMLDPRLLATVSLISTYVFADSPDQVNPYLVPRV